MVSSSGQATETEMVPIMQNNKEDADTADTAELVRKNYSVHSFSSDNNELTVTHWLDDRRFSMLSFKPCEKNVIDIEVTRGECNTGKQTLRLKEIGSRDLRSKNSIKAKAGLITILLLLLAMVMVIVFAIVIRPWVHNDPDSVVTRAPTTSVYSDTVTILAGGKHVTNQPIGTAPSGDGTQHPVGNFTYT